MTFQLWSLAQYTIIYIQYTVSVTIVRTCSLSRTEWVVIKIKLNLKLKQTLELGKYEDYLFGEQPQLKIAKSNQLISIMQIGTLYFKNMQTQGS